MQLHQLDDFFLKVNCPRIDMGFSQDAIDIWDRTDDWKSITSKEDSYNIQSQDKMKWLRTLDKMNQKYNMPRPTKRDLNNGFLRTFHELSPTTQSAVYGHVLQGNDEYHNQFEKLEHFKPKFITKNGKRIRIR